MIEIKNLTSDDRGREVYLKYEHFTGTVYTAYGYLLDWDVENNLLFVSLESHFWWLEYVAVKPEYAYFDETI